MPGLPGDVLSIEGLGGTWTTTPSLLSLLIDELPSIRSVEAAHSYRSNEIWMEVTEIDAVLLTRC